MPRSSDRAGAQHRLLDIPPIGMATSIVGPGPLIAFVLNFIITPFTALSYAELASGHPETGGRYPWIKEGLIAPLGFLGGWMSWQGHCIACSQYAIGFGRALDVIARRSTRPVPMYKRAGVSRE